MGFTDVVVTCNGGSSDEEEEHTFRKREPIALVQVAQRMLNKASCNPPLILHGCWAEGVAKTGNFVYRLVGDLSTEAILACKDALCSHFPGDSWIVPTKGWTWIQLRGVDYSYIEDDTEFLYDAEHLLKVLTANPCFQNTDIFIPPYWQGNPLNFRHGTAMVIAAIGDADHSHCQRASSEGVYMFGRQIKFIQAGDSPSLVQCSRCHKIGHYYSSPKCCVATNTIRCYVCGGAHDSASHSFECLRMHKVQGKCDCVPKCLLCGASGHHARAKNCPQRGDFVPPRLPKVAPVEVTPVEDTRVVVPPAALRRMTQPPPGRKGKGVAKAGGRQEAMKLLVEEAGNSVPKEVCQKSGNYNLLCYCCPMPELEEYRMLYIGSNSDSLPPLVLSTGKSLIDLHSEFVACKAAGESAITMAQSTHPHIFHKDEELAGLITQAGARLVRDIPYGPALDPPAWLTNMPEDMLMEEDSKVDAVQEADEAASAWKAV
jgi:hypothetical protein